MNHPHDEEIIEVVPVSPRSGGRSRRPAHREDSRCPYCFQRVWALARRCRHCGEKLDEDSLDTARERIEEDRSQYLLPAIALGIGGFGLMVLGHLLVRQEREVFMILVYIGLIVTCMGLALGAMYKGRSPAWALLGIFLCMLIGLIVVLSLPDEHRGKRQRIDNLLADNAELEN